MDLIAKDRARREDSAAKQLGAEIASSSGPARDRIDGGGATRA